MESRTDDRRAVRISVIVPVWNAGAHLREVIEALLEQEYPARDYEILLVDNGSRDDSVEIIRRYGGVKLLRQPKAGSYAARNLGVAEARGEMLAFTDSDCVAGSGWLRAMEAGFSKPEALVLLGRTRPAEESGLQALLADYENEKAEYVCEVGERRQQYAYTNNMAVRAEMWRRYGPFVELMRGADVSFVRRVVDGEPRGAVAYRREMTVRHLELRGMGSYYRKMFIYGRSLQGYRKVTPVEALTLDDRVRVFLRTANRRGYGAWQAAALAGGLAGGLAAWTAGGLAGGSWRGRKGDAREEERAAGPGDGLQGARISVIVEWENAVLAEKWRGPRMLAELASQIRGLAGTTIAVPAELLVVYRTDHVAGGELEAMARGALDRTEDLIERRLIGCDEGEYYELKNRGASEAHGDILVFLDSDTIPEAGWLECLLRPLGDERLESVCGCSYIEPKGVMGRAFGVLWFFPPRQESKRLEPAKQVFANNFAVRRRLFERHPFRPVAGTSRGACVRWREEMLAGGIGIVQSYGARVAHPPPNGARHFVVRALTHGRDFLLQARAQGRAFEGGALGTLGRTALNLTRSTMNVWGRRRAVGVSLLEAPLTLAIAYAYYGIYFCGELLTYAAPGWMTRRFRI